MTSEDKSTYNIRYAHETPEQRESRAFAPIAYRRPDTPHAADDTGFAPNTAQLSGMSHAAWEQERIQEGNKPWRDSPEGRLAIRCFSRGIMGAAFYAIGNRYAGNTMASYHPHEAPKNWVQGIARAFDVVAGKPIEMAVNFLGADGKRAVTFRPTRKFYQGLQDGRTLGHDAVMVTFDFAAMSVGDALGRDIAGLFDPNVKLSWIKDGRLDAPQALKSLAMSAWRIGTYHQGEDWAVALPYVYYLRWQRNVINHFSPGFAYDSDRNLNGGSFKIDKHGKVIGNYSLEGILDLQGRFTAYNIGTLMFRETYLDITDKILHAHECGPEQAAKNDKPKNLLQSAADHINATVKWAARDIVKGTMYMTPAVPFFWMTRTPQTKYRGLFINPEKGAVAYNSGKMFPDFVHANELRRSKSDHNIDQSRFRAETNTFFSKYDRENGWHINENVSNPISKTGFKSYSYRFNPADEALNDIGYLNNRIRRKGHDVINYAENGLTKEFTDSWRAKNLTDNFINASISYTPYFYTKAEFGRMIDTGRMDHAIERAYDGFTRLNSGEFIGGIKDVWNTLHARPLDDPEQEKKAQERVKNDISPADVFDPKLFGQGARSSTPCFTERLKKQKEEAQARMDALKREFGGSHAKSIAAQQVHKKEMQKPEMPAERPSSFVDQETLREFQRGELPDEGVTLH